MSKQEMLVLSTKDRDRLKVLHEVKRKHLTQRAAARQLGISDRWVRKLLVRVRKGGDGGIVHRGRGRRSNRRLPESLRTDRKSTRLNSSHLVISYAVFCLKKKKKTIREKS